MSKLIKGCIGIMAVTLVTALLPPSFARAQTCLGDCNANGTVSAGELTKIIAIILNCGGVASGCAAVPGGCTAADKNGNGIISAGELTNIISNILNLPNGCPVSNGPTPTNTAVAPTNTPPPSATRTATSSPTPTPSPQAAVCGDGIVQGPDEDCDDGGVCTGGDNAGTPCTSEADCHGEGVCDGGTHIGTACSSDTDCPNAKCVHCKTFGGDGCAANCTFETDIPVTLLPGATKSCKGGTNDGKACASGADCPAGPAGSPTPACTGYKGCLGGANDGKACTTATDCAPTGGNCTSVPVPGTTASFVHGGILQLPLPLSGTQTLTVGKLRNGKIPGIIKADSVKLGQIAVGVVACACVRGVAAKTCGGTLTNSDGTASDNCTPGYTAGDSVCAGKKPCAFVSGPGNATAGIIGCDGLTPVNMLFTQDGGGMAEPPAPTPPPHAGPAVITLTDTGPPGSGLLLNTSAIGQASGSCTAQPKCALGVCSGGTNNGKTCSSGANCPGTGASCVGFGKACTKNADCPMSVCSGVNTLENAGPDLTFCKNVGTPQDDDPQSTRGTAQTLPQVTGIATGEITNTLASSTHQIGPFSYVGSPYICANLSGANPKASGAVTVGAFTALNQVTLGDIVVRSVFVVQ